MFMNARSQDLLYIKLLRSIFILSFPVTYQYINHKLGNCFDQYIYYLAKDHMPKLFSVSFYLAVVTHIAIKILPI